MATNGESSWSTHGNRTVCVSRCLTDKTTETLTRPFGPIVLTALIGDPSTSRYAGDLPKTILQRPAGNVGELTPPFV